MFRRYATRETAWRGLMVAVPMLLLVGECRAYEVALTCPAAPDSSCVVAEVGESFGLQARARAGHGRGLVYVTLRLGWPGSLDLRAAPVLGDTVVGLTTTPYPDGTTEWHLVVEGCPEGWVTLFRQTVRVLESSPATVDVVGADSWIRDCSFDLHRVDIVSPMGVNRPDCIAVDAGAESWTRLKVRTIQPR